MSTNIVAFSADLKRVARKADQLRAAAENWNAYYLNYLADWIEVYDRARKDKNNDAVKQLEELGTLDGNSIDNSAVSKIRKIVGGKASLLNVKESLPPSRDALYEFIKSYERKKSKNLTPKQFVRQFSISPNTSVRTIRNIGAKKPVKGKSPAIPPSQLTARSVQKLVDFYQQDRVELSGITVKSIKLFRTPDDGDTHGLTLLVVHRKFDQDTEKDVFAAILNFNDRSVIEKVVAAMSEDRLKI